MHFESIDLRHDRAAASYAKHEDVQVVFALADGQIASREGINHYRAGDALVTGSGGDRWSVSRDRFDRRYQPLAPLAHGSHGAYRSLPRPVLARQIGQAFTVRRSADGDLLRGDADDWLLQYAPGDWGVVEDAKFRRLYRRA
jgi:hypothetical protein